MCWRVKKKNTINWMDFKSVYFLSSNGKLNPGNKLLKSVFWLSGCCWAFELTMTKTIVTKLSFNNIVKKIKMDSAKMLPRYWYLNQSIKNIYNYPPMFDIDIDLKNVFIRENKNTQEGGLRKRIRVRDKCRVGDRVGFNQIEWWIVLLAPDATWLDSRKFVCVLRLLLFL